MVTFCGYWFASFCLADLKFRVFKIQNDVEFLDAQSVTLIFCASLVSAIGALGWLYASNYKLLTRLLQWIAATKH